jgi:putative pyruvate formate lyase activating enzyme
MKFEELWIWKFVKEDLEWYYEVETNSKPAKYLIAKRVAVDFDESDDINNLWKYFEKSTSEFLKLWNDVKNGEDVSKLEIPKKSLLDLLASITKKWLTKCTFCRWKCKVNRIEGKKLGACMLDTESRVGAYFHHRGEELVFRGTKGSGTIFFTSCNMRCGFCQNGDISTDRFNGVKVTPKDLAFIMKELRLEGVHNINLVGGEPTIHLHTIIEAINLLAKEGFTITSENEDLIKSVKSDIFIFYPTNIKWASYKGELNVPILWNSNFYMSEETTKLLRIVIDIWLPDFKFGNNKCALRLSRTPWYVETVTNNLKTVRDWGENMIIRHLIMPNHVYDDTFPVLEWISKNMPEVWINIMDQYHPDNYADPDSPKFKKEYQDIARYPTTKEIEEAWLYAKKLGLKFDVITLEKRLFL